MINLWKQYSNVGIKEMKEMKEITEFMLKDSVKILRTNDSAEG